MVFDVNDVDNHEGNDGTNQFIGPEFCDDWKNYQTQCLNGSTSMEDVYQPWAGFMINNPDLFFDAIEGLPECISTDEMEDIICVENALAEFVLTYELNLTLKEKFAIKQKASCGEGFDDEAAEIFIELINQNEFFESPSLEDFQNEQGDQENTYLAHLQKAIKALKAAGVDWYADFIQELIDCEEFETHGDLRDTWYMVKDFISNYNQFLICQREQEVTEWMLAIFSPENVGIILGYVNFAPSMSVGYRAAFSVRFAQTATNLCSNLNKGFDTFASFKQAYGNAGTGKAWHHIVEQNQIQNSGFIKKMVHHPDNLIKIESGAGSWHSRINSAYATNGYFPQVTGANQSLRKWLVGKPFELQYEWGLKVVELTK